MWGRCFRLPTSLFLYNNHAIRRSLQPANGAAWPVNIDRSFGRGSEAEVHAQVALRNVAPSAADFVGLTATVGRRAVDACPDSGAIRFRAGGLDLDPVVLQ